MESLKNIILYILSFLMFGVFILGFMKGCELLGKNNSPALNKNRVDTITIVKHDTIRVSTVINSTAYIYKDMENVIHFKIDCVHIIDKGIKYIPVKELKKNFPNHNYCCTWCSDKQLINELLGDDVDIKDNTATIINIDNSNYND